MGPYDAHTGADFLPVCVGQLAGLYHLVESPELLHIGEAREVVENSVRHATEEPLAGTSSIFIGTVTLFWLRANIVDSDTSL